MKGDLSFRKDESNILNRPEVSVEVVNDSIRNLEEENKKLRVELFDVKPSIKRAEQELGLEKDLNKNLNEKIAKLTEQFD